MHVFKKIFYCLLALAILLAAGYFQQSPKEGKGIDQTTKYELVKSWPNLPKHLILGSPVGIGIDTAENIVVFHRANRKWPLIGPMPKQPIESNTVLIVNKETGNLVDSWGSGYFIMPHGLTVDRNNNVWVTDVGLQQVFKFDYKGKLLLKLGVPGVAGNDSLHFNKPTDIAVADDGSFYVSDGYGNSRIMKFSPEGKFLLQWGRKGNKDGEFDIPHGISLDVNGNVYVADRENNRVQVFNPTGKFIKKYTDKSFGAMFSVIVGETSKTFAIDDFTFFKLKHRGSDIIVFDKTGNVQTRFGRSGSYGGATSWYHDLIIDKEENIYVGDILGNKIQKFTKVKSGL